MCFSFSSTSCSFHQLFLLCTSTTVRTSSPGRCSYAVNETPGTQLTRSNKFYTVTPSCLLQSNITTTPWPQMALRSISQVLTPHPLPNDMFCVIQKIIFLSYLPRSKTSYDQTEPRVITSCDPQTVAPF